MWVVDSLDETLVRIDPDTGSVTATIPVGRSPAGVAVGGGSVWVANSGDGTVTRIDPDRQAHPTIAVGGSPQALTVAAGRVWVTVDARSITPNPIGSRRRDAADRVLQRRRLHGPRARGKRILVAAPVHDVRPACELPGQGRPRRFAADARGRPGATRPAPPTAGPTPSRSGPAFASHPRRTSRSRRRRSRTRSSAP